MHRLQDKLPKFWQGWTIDEDFLYSPNGDKFLPVQILVCHFITQMEDYRKVLWEWPDSIQ